jgi:hypothetical protein
LHLWSYEQNKSSSLNYVRYFVPGTQKELAHWLYFCFSVWPNEATEQTKKLIIGIYWGNRKHHFNAYC